MAVAGPLAALVAQQGVERGDDGGPRCPGKFAVIGLRAHREREDCAHQHEERTAGGGGAASILTSGNLQIARAPIAFTLCRGQTQQRLGPPAASR